MHAWYITRKPAATCKEGPMYVRQSSRKAQTNTDTTIQTRTQLNHNTLQNVAVLEGSTTLPNTRAGGMRHCQHAGTL